MQIRGLNSKNVCNFQIQMKLNPKNVCNFSIQMKLNAKNVCNFRIKNRIEQERIEQNKNKHTQKSACERKKFNKKHKVKKC